MKLLLRPARAAECPALSELCMRSKAYWGYDAAFMEACRSELSVVPSDEIIVAEVDQHLAGIAQVDMSGTFADLEKLFVDPVYIGKGLGRVLFEWCVQEACRLGSDRLMIEADPQAAPFYKRMGAKTVGTAPSASIPGRELPLLEYRIKG